MATLSMGCRFADIEVGKNGTGCKPTIGGSDNGILPCGLAANFLVITLKTRFILINTSHAGNVGAAARAMKVMGFDDLVLVAPRWANVLRREETIQRASGALDVLKNARIVETLDEALDGMTHLCATAMTPRDFGPPTRAPREHFRMLLNQELLAHVSIGLEANLTCENDRKLPQNTEKPEGVAFLFGSERFGMQNEDVYRCNVALSIPTDPNFGSLNLGAAVQLIAYDWREALGGFNVQPATVEPRLADAKEVAGMLKHLEEALVAIDFLDPTAPKKLMPRLNQLVNRAQLSPEEIHILRGIAKMMMKKSAPASPSS
jgi:tRNA/rRNA methyltransferase